MKTEPAAWWMYIIAAILLVGIGLAFVYHRQKNRSRLLEAEIRLDVGDRGDLIINGKSIRHDFSAEEFALLKILMKRDMEGRGFVATDEIESMLWPDVADPAYLRKLRGKTLDRLESRLQARLPKPDQSRWIIERSSPDDQRRKEYRINAEPYGGRSAIK